MTSDRGGHDAGPEPLDAAALTEDRFYGGRLTVRQYRDGYRFSVDAVLLAAFALPWIGRTAVEFGTGCGIVSLLMAMQSPAAHFYAVEIQPLLARLAEQNISGNGLADRITVLPRDVKSISSSQFEPVVDSVVCNPPFYPLGAGRINPNDQRAQARHEIRVTLADIIASARRTVKKSGSLMVVYPVERVAELISNMRDGGIEPKLMQCVHANADSDAQLVLMRGRSGGQPGMTIAPPIVMYRRNGEYTAAFARLLTA